MAFQYFKALHIVFIVTWFAGLFYIVRLFIYMMEAHEGAKEPAKSILLNQYKIMSKRLWYGITWPSAVITLLMGLSLVYFYLYKFNLGIPTWLWIKIGFVAGLYAYHVYCHSMFKKLQQNTMIWSSQKLRIWNEVATIFLISIIFLVVLRSALSMAYGIIGLIIFSLILLIAIRIYKKVRENKM